MPLTPQRSSPYASDRRSASGKRDSDVTKTEWPLLTRTAYHNLARNDAKDVNPKMLRLAMGKIHLGRAMIAVDGAIRDHNPQVKGNTDEGRKIYNKLRAIRRDIERLTLDYPLEVR